MTTDLQYRFAVARSILQYDRLKREAEKLPQREQRELVDAMIAARFRIEGGVA